MMHERQQPESRSEFKEKLLIEMTTSIKANETREFRREGCLDGVELCRKLESLEEFERMLISRHDKESSLRTPNNSEAYWRYRCATMQVEHVYERMKAFCAISENDYNEALSARAFLTTVRILKGGKPGDEFRQEDFES